VLCKAQDLYLITLLPHEKAELCAYRPHPAPWVPKALAVLDEVALSSFPQLNPQPNDRGPAGGCVEAGVEMLM